MITWNDTPLATEPNEGYGQLGLNNLLILKGIVRGPLGQQLVDHFRLEGSLN